MKERVTANKHGNIGEDGTQDNARPDAQAQQADPPIHLWHFDRAADGYIYNITQRPPWRTSEDAQAREHYLRHSPEADGHSRHFIDPAHMQEAIRIAGGAGNAHAIKYDLQTQEFVIDHQRIHERAVENRTTQAEREVYRHCTTQSLCDEIETIVRQLTEFIHVVNAAAESPEFRALRERLGQRTQAVREAAENAAVGLEQPAQNETRVPPPQ